MLDYNNFVEIEINDRQTPIAIEISFIIVYKSNNFNVKLAPIVNCLESLLINPYFKIENNKRTSINTLNAT